MPERLRCQETNTPLSLHRGNSEGREPHRAMYFPRVLGRCTGFLDSCRDLTLELSQPLLSMTTTNWYGRTLNTFRLYLFDSTVVVCLHSHFTPPQDMGLPSLVPMEKQSLVGKSPLCYQQSRVTFKRESGTKVDRQATVEALTLGTGL